MWGRCIIALPLRGVPLASVTHTTAQAPVASFISGHWPAELTRWDGGCPFGKALQKQGRDMPFFKQEFYRNCSSKSAFDFDVLCLFNSLNTTPFGIIQRVSEARVWEFGLIHISLIFCISRTQSQWNILILSNYWSGFWLINNCEMLKGFWNLLCIFT